MTAADFARVLSQIESGGNPAAIGDGGQAITSYQVHPAWVYRWSQIHAIVPALSATWESYVLAIVIAFFEHQISMRTPAEIAMAFHVGHVVARYAPAWDLAYAARFRAAAAKLGVAIA